MNTDSSSLFKLENSGDISELYKLVENINRILGSKNFEELSDFYYDNWNIFFELFHSIVLSNCFFKDCDISSFENQFSNRDSKIFKSLISNFINFIYFLHSIEIVEPYSKECMYHSYHSCNKSFSIKFCFNIPDVKKNRFQTICKFEPQNFLCCKYFLFNFLFTVSFGFTNIINNSDNTLNFYSFKEFIDFFIKRPQTAFFGDSNISYGIVDWVRPQTDDMNYEISFFCKISSKALQNMLYVSFESETLSNLKVFEKNGEFVPFLSGVIASSIYFSKEFSSYLPLYFESYFNLLYRVETDTAFKLFNDYMIYFNFEFKGNVNSIHRTIFFDSIRLKESLEKILLKYYIDNGNVMAISDGMVKPFKSFIDYFFDFFKYKNKL